MTESSITETPTEPALDFDAWLAGAGLAQGSVEILQKPALLAQWDDLARRYERAQDLAAAGEAGITDEAPHADLEREAAELLAELEASRTILHVRALIPSDLAAILAAHPVKPGPQFRDKIPSVQPNPTENQSKAWLGMWEAYGLRKEEWEADNAAAIDAHREETLAALLAQGAEKVSRSVTRVEQGGRVIAEHITVDQVMKLAEMIGDAQVSKIIAKIDEVSAAAPEVPAGFLSRSSASDRS